MKKVEFLKELEERLKVLNENEKRDILEEYEQHIDMKMEGGMEEEDAIADFGDIKEFVDEILSAYNVNLKYNKPDPMQRMANGVSSVSKNIWDKTKSGSKKTGNVISRFLDFCSAKLSAFWGKVTTSCKKLKEKLTGRRDDRMKVQNREQNIEYGDGTENTNCYENRKSGSSGFRRIWENIKRVIACIFDWCIKCFLILANIPFVFMGAVTIFLFGMAIILNIKGYPIIGIVVGLLGGIAILVGICAFLILLYLKNKKYYWTTAVSAGIGLLLVGIGTGITIVEFSTFSYGGQIVVNENDMTTERSSLKIAEEGSIYFGREGYMYANIEVIADETISSDEVVFDITYDKNLYQINVEPNLANYYGIELDAPIENQLMITTDYVSGGDLRNIMKAKDYVIDGIREKVLYGVECDYTRSIVIRVSPDNVDRVVDVDRIDQ